MKGKIGANNGYGFDSGKNLSFKLVYFYFYYYYYYSYFLGIYK